MGTAEQKFTGKDIEGGVLNSTQFGLWNAIPGKPWSWVEAQNPLKYL